jgi:hypothetical protein
MALLDTVWSAIGPGASGAALAAATYAGAAALEKEARLGAKQDIAKFLRSFGGDFNVSLVTSHISDFFDIIFGEKHFSAKCILRSIALTLIFCCLTLLFAIIKTRDFITNIVLDANKKAPLLADQLPSLSKQLFETLSDPEFRNLEIYIIFVALFVSVLAITAPVDYISLWKSRAILRYISRPGNKIYKVLFLAGVDFVLSICIFAIYWTTMINLIIFGQPFLKACTETALLIYSLPKGYSMLLGQADDMDSLVNVICVTSTILTSIWTIAIVLSASCVRIVISLKYPLAILTWLFDVDEHPIKIIGIMLSGFVWSGSVVYALL